MSDEKKIRLLIVDDEVKFLESIAKRLELRGLDVATASNGVDAIQKAREGTFDLVLLDLKMPGMDGRQVMEVLKKEHKFVEVIILTGHGSVDSAVECTRLGAFDYLPKPYEMENLLKVLHKAYEARLMKKFDSDQKRLEKIAKLAVGGSPLSILRELRKLDDDEK
jgi:DNA-binding NtrC family response regulator